MKRTLCTRWSPRSLLQACASAPELDETQSRSEFRSAVDGVRAAAAGGRNDLQPRRQLRPVHGSARARRRRHPHDPARRAHQRVERVEHVDGARQQRRHGIPRHRGRADHVGRRADSEQRDRERHDVRRPGRLEPEQPPRRQHHGDRRGAAAERQPARARREAHHDQSRRGVHSPRRHHPPRRHRPGEHRGVDEGRGRGDHLQRQRQSRRPRTAPAG